MKSNSEWVEIDGGQDDRALASAVRSALRAQSLLPLVISGSLDRQIDDLESFRRWVIALAFAPVPVFVGASGPIGHKGIALLLVGHVGLIAQSATLVSNWRAAPGLGVLMSRRLGRGTILGALFGNLDPLAAMEQSGAIARVDDPAAVCRAHAAAVAGTSDGARLASGLRAAEELPFGEALDFDLWSERMSASR